MNRLVNTVLLALLLWNFTEAQTLDELKTNKSEKEAMLAEKSSEVSALEAEIASLNDQILLLSGWRTGFAGLVGLNFSESENWAANPNPNSSSTGLNLALNVFANRNEAKWFWNNKLLANKSWQTIDINGEDGGDLFDNSTNDILNLSSLFGYKLTKKIAASALGEMNTSIENFLEPGTIDFGLGATWTPNPNLVVVVHPLNYRISFPPSDSLDISSEGAVGAKLRADYARNLKISGKDVNWSSTLTAFIPYSDTKMMVTDLEGNAQEAGMEELTWLNTLSFTIWKGIGVGATFGFRNADFEVYEEWQKFYALGLTYTL